MVVAEDPRDERVGAAGGGGEVAVDEPGPARRGLRVDPVGVARSGPDRVGGGAVDEA